MRWELMADGLRVHTPAKLNLYLEIGGRRAGGYHDIDSIFQAISLHDVLEFWPTKDGSVTLEAVGMEAAEDNLVHRAARMVKECLLPEGSPHGVRIRLTKRIPEGAGLGGGSSDAAGIRATGDAVISGNTNALDSMVASAHSGHSTFHALTSESSTPISSIASAISSASWKR